MSDTKISGLTAATSVGLTDQFAIAQSGASKSATLSVVRVGVGEGLNNAALSSVSAAYSSDTYLAGSAITIPTAGGWVAGTTVRWEFDMTKTGAGVATPIITVRMGTLGTTGDASITTLTWAAGTANADSGVFRVGVIFRSVGSGTSAVIQAKGELIHQLTTTGLSNNTTNYSVILATSAGFNSTTQTIIGLSFNGGASFSGTTTYITADGHKI